MAKSKQAVQFEVREVKIGQGYYVHMMPPNAVPEDTYGFDSPDEAQAWGEENPPPRLRLATASRKAARDTRGRT